MRAFEDQRRAATDFAALPPSDVSLGPDPYRVVALRGGKRFAGLLRGESAVVIVDDRGAELARAPAPRSPSGLAVSADDDLLVVGEDARELAHYRFDRGRLARISTLPVDALALRDVALAPDGRTAYVVEEHDGRLLAVPLQRDHRALRAGRSGARELGRCHGPVRVAAITGAVAVDCLLDHAIEIRRDGAELARIQHDGPIWSFALQREPDGGLLVVVGGIEDHPLEREDGGFGYIDSYVYLYRVAPHAQPSRLAAINTSALGVVTPKWIAFRGGATASVLIAGYASAPLVTLTWDNDLTAPPRVEQVELLPGTAAAALAADGTLLAANPLFDAWIVRRAGELQVVPVASATPARPVDSRIGELLFFTTMMAPWNSAEGKLSRFTCETCHHEGYVDGRVHFTGRGTVHAATRPLLGLFNNRPHFSRALDKTTTQMVDAEFRVANRHNGRDPWFALSRADIPWLDRVAGAPAVLSPELLRQSFMSFLRDFSHRANPAAIDERRESREGGHPLSIDERREHAGFTSLERAGAQTFRDRCAGCHAARLIAEDGRTDVAFDRWESLILSPSGPILWSNATYQKTGVTPYVHDSGARVPPLRRLYKKWPYFTNGAAHSLAGLLDRFAASPTATYHDSAPADPALVRLTPNEKTALLAFLDLL